MTIDQQQLTDEQHGTQALWPQMIRALSAIDAALGLPEDGCNSTGRTLAAIRELQQAAQAAEEAAYQRSVPLTDAQIDGIAADGFRNAAGGIYATSVYDFARAIEGATLQRTKDRSKET